MSRDGALAAEIGSFRRYSAQDAVAAIGRVKSARASLDALDGLIAKGQFEAAAEAVASPPLSTFEADATVLVQAPARFAASDSVRRTPRAHARRRAFAVDPKMPRR